MSKDELKDISLKGVIQLVFIAPAMLVVLLLSAGRWDWWEAWAYSILGILVMVISRVIVIRKFPDLAVERSRAPDKEDTKEWDKFLMPFTALVAPLISWIVAGLDVRFGWSPDLPVWIQITALFVLQSGTLFGTWAMLSNRFFSSQVRIQADRGHTVIKDGPYRFVRHPGYAGGLISWLVSPVFFSSWVLIFPAILAIAASLIRTFKEDQTLQEELPGYKEYAEEVKYRLVPGIW